MSQSSQAVVSKVPAVTLGFWLIKILATTLGETGGDAVTMTLGLGYLMFSQTLGTALGDFLADTGEPGYGGGALVFSAALAVVAGLYFFTQNCAYQSSFLARDRRRRGTCRGVGVICGHE